MNSHKIPVHVAIIPDGNRRYAKAKGLPVAFGHGRGYERTKEIISNAQEKGVKFLTLWAFSTENWGRGEEEVSELLKLIKRGLIELYNEARIQKTRLVHIGRRDRLGSEIVSLLESIEKETESYNDFCLCIAIDYGGEDEIKRAEEKLKMSNDSSKHIADFLDTVLIGVPSPDLIIRTGGEKRTSGFLPLQSAYAEWIFEERMFPDFDEEAFQIALDEYALRARRFGR
jgi:undecaprenyl diphosphate synthase